MTEDNPVIAARVVLESRIVSALIEAGATSSEMKAVWDGLIPVESLLDKYRIESES